MPKPPLKHFSKPANKRLGIGFVINFTLWVFLFVLGFFVFKKSDKLYETKDSVGDLVQVEVEITEAPEPKKQDSPPQLVVENNEPEWCDSLNYSDLSNHSTILDFDKWMVHYEGFQRFDHQNCLDCGTQPNLFNEQSSNGFIERIRNNLIRKGEKLAIKRSETFQKIIKGDPRKALEIAVSENRLKKSPSSNNSAYGKMGINIC